MRNGLYFSVGAPVCPITGFLKFPNNIRLSSFVDYAIRLRNLDLASTFGFLKVDVKLTKKKKPAVFFFSDAQYFHFLFFLETESHSRLI